jgi:hypothetical protein
MQLAYNGTGSLIAAANEDGSVGIYDAQDLRPLQRFRVGPKHGIVKGIQFSVDSRHVVTLNGNGTVYVLRLSDFAASNNH